MKDFTIFEISAQKDKFKINLKAFFMGSDLIVLIWGGDPHAGAVSFFSPEEQTITLRRKNHKDHEITEIFTARLGLCVKGCIVAICGIHFSDLCPDDITEIKKLCERLADQLANFLVEKA